MLLPSNEPPPPDDATLLRFEEMMAGNTMPVYVGPEHYEDFLNLRPEEMANLVFATIRAQGKFLALTFYEAARAGSPDYFPRLVSDTLFAFAVGVSWFDELGRLRFRRRHGPRPDKETYSKFAAKIASAQDVIKAAISVFTSEVMKEHNQSTKKASNICSYEDSVPQDSVKLDTRVRTSWN